MAILYTTRATATGGRSGSARSEDGALTAPAPQTWTKLHLTSAASGFSSPP